MWNYIWNYRQQDYLSWPSKISKQTQVIRVKVNQRSSTFRLAFSNLYGVEDIEFEEVSVTRLSENAIPESETIPVYCDGHSSCTIKAGCSEKFSDTIPLEIYPNTIIEITTVLARETILTGGIVSYSRLQQEVLNYQTDSNKKRIFQDQMELFQMVKNNPRMFYIYGVSGVQCDSPQTNIVVFGDSLTQQGFWLDQFKQRLLNEKITNTSVINKGIGGGRILFDTSKEVDTFQRHGRSGVKRFLSDVFHSEPVDSVLVFYGINDLMTVDDQLSDEQLLSNITEAYQFFCEEAHLRRSAIYLCTILPFGHSPYFNERSEKLRLQLNEWIRTTTIADGFFDFSEAVTEKNHPKYLVRSYECGDGLHLSAEGGKQVANAIEIAKLSKGVS